jgi:peptidoglycan/xylan/chitin deacetylase (PgdA/CDA1 family)
MLNSLIRKSLAAPRRVPGYLPLWRQARSWSAAIVMYHGVTATHLPFANWCQLDTGAFADQIAFLVEEYTILPLAELVDRLARHRPLPKRAAVLTFDDGFRNVFTTAAPILEHHQAPATVFLVTGLVGSRQPPWPEQLFLALAHTQRAAAEWDGEVWPLSDRARRAAAYLALATRLKELDTPLRQARLAALFDTLGRPPTVALDSPLAILDWDEIERLARSALFTFGCHTHTHPILARCSPEAQHEELLTSRDILRERLGSAELFAYPNGRRSDFTTFTKKLLLELEYRCGVTTIPGLNPPAADLYELHRVCVGADTTLPEFELRMIGL